MKRTNKIFLLLLTAITYSCAYAMNDNPPVIPAPQWILRVPIAACGTQEETQNRARAVLGNFYMQSFVSKRLAQLWCQLQGSEQEIREALRQESRFSNASLNRDEPFSLS